MRSIKPTTLLYLFAGLIAFKTSMAQDTLMIPKKKSYLKITGSYLTNAVYNGRQDSVATPYLSGAIGYFHKSGLSISGNVSYQPNTGIIDVFSLGAGFSHNISDEFSFSVNANKPFYSAASTAVQSAIKGSVSANITYDPGIVTIDAGASSLFSDNTDIMANLGLSHQFSIKGVAGSFWGITPTITANYGTPYFYESYKTRAAKAKNLAISSSSTTGNNKFQLLAIELAIPLSYDSKRWGISIIPTYGIPQNPIETTTTSVISIGNKSRTNTSTDTESLKNIFYGQVSFYLKF